MSEDDKDVLVEAMQSLFMLMHTQCEIATLIAKNQNAPKYLYEQVIDLREQIIREIRES